MVQKKTLNEISAKLALNYLKKKQERDYVQTGPFSSRRKEPQTFDQAAKDARSDARALRVLKKAGQGLTKESEERMFNFFALRQDLVEKTLTPAEKKKREEVAKAIERDQPGMPMAKKMAIATATAKKVAEEKEPITELSKKTLGSYVKAAAKDAEEAGRDQEYHGHNNDYARGEKRQKGIAKAVDRLTKEETELEEASYTGKGNHRPGWMLKADPKLAQKFKEKKAQYQAKAKAMGNPSAGISVKEEIEPAKQTYSVDVTHYHKDDAGKLKPMVHNYKVKNATSVKHAKNIAMLRHREKVGMKPGERFETGSQDVKQL